MTSKSPQWVAEQLAARADITVTITSTTTHTITADQWDEYQRDAAAGVAGHGMRGYMIADHENVIRHGRRDTLTRTVTGTNVATGETVVSR